MSAIDCSLLTRAALGPAVCAALVACSSGSGLSLPLVAQGPGITPEEGRARLGGQAGGAGVASMPAATPPAGATPSVNAAPASLPPVAAPAPAGAAAGYPQASRYGDLLFISGQIAMDPRTRRVAGESSAEDQVRMALENVRGVLEANGLTMANVVSTTVFLKNINELPALEAGFRAAFRGALPSRTVVEVSRLPAGVAVQISAVAGR